jgi:hypothetical protein
VEGIAGLRLPRRIPDESAGGVHEA